MAEQVKKPRNIKDLKARLGRTIAPNQGGASAAVAPPNLGGMPAGSVAPPPSLTPPPGLGSAGIPGGSSVPAPPFLQPRRPSVAPDPFAAGPAQPAGPQEVRLVIDEKPVADSEVGREKRGRLLIVGGLTAVVGLALGLGFGSVNSSRKTYNLAVSEGKDIYAKVRESSEVVSKAQRLVDKAVATAKGGSGGKPGVDFGAIEELRSLEKPFQAGDFARKRYNAFNPAAVDALFEYYNNVNLLWAKFESIANRTLPTQRREQMARAAEAADQMASLPTGCVPVVEEGQTLCGMVFVHPIEGSGTKANVSSTPQGRVAEKTIYTGQDFSKSPDSFVILTHTPRSLGVLGQSANLFAEYQRDLLEIKQLMDKTLEVQGRLERELGEVARLEELFAI